MSTTTRLTAPEEIEYPETDGEPMSENTDQYHWITLIEEGVRDVFRDDPHVFIAADLLWYPVAGNVTIRRAPDVLVAFGRSKEGRRGAYVQVYEEGIAPQVVFEILSPSNRGPELARKFEFSETYGVEEYYIYDPDFFTLEGWLRADDRLSPIPEMNGSISPRLGVRFELIDTQFRLYGPDNQPFVPADESKRQAREQTRRADEQTRLRGEERRRADEEVRLHEEERRRADQEARRADEQQRRADEQQREIEEQRRQNELMAA